LIRNEQNCLEVIVSWKCRYTNAQMWIRFGVERSGLSKLMDHEKEQTTENYYRVGLREVIEVTKSINFEKLAI
jgi:hypothetical protein